MENTLHLFVVKIIGLKTKPNEEYFVESILCDEYDMRKLDGSGGFNRFKTGDTVTITGEFRICLPVGTSALEYVPNIRALIYKATERYVRTEIEAYPIGNGIVYEGCDLEFAKMKKDGLLDTDLDEMEEYDGE